MAARGKASITDSSGGTTFGPQATGECTMQNRGSNIAYGVADKSTAVADIGFTIAPGESVNTKDLPGAWNYGNFNFVCASGETATIYWAQK